MEDYSKLDSPYLQPQVNFPKQNNVDGYIITQSTDGNFDPTPPPTNWLKITMIVIGAVVLLGGVGSVIFMIKNTTDAVTNAAKNQNAQISEIINEGSAANNSFSLVTKVQAGYEDPFQPTAQESNPFTEAKNPFDEIGQ